MNKLLVICGPTASGKTDLSLFIAQKFGGELISADSRQVYRGMDIGTGKDIPQEFKIHNSKFKIGGKETTYYTNGQVKLWGLDLVTPNELFSVADFARFALPVIQDIWRRGRLPIIAGGTGLYIRSITTFLPEIFVTRNTELRRKLESLSLPQLQRHLKLLDTKRFGVMNKSDRLNPRRLVRAIEISTQKAVGNKKELNEYKEFVDSLDTFKIYLSPDIDLLIKRIEQRIAKRVKQGIIEEVRGLVNTYGWNVPAMSGLGYDIWKDYVEGKMTLQDTINLWKKDEQNYSKRQLLWFKKESDLYKIDTSETKWQEKVLRMVTKWLA